jgi:hypothetical protein
MGDVRFLEEGVNPYKNSKITSEFPRRGADSPPCPCPLQTEKKKVSDGDDLQQQVGRASDMIFG